MKYSRRNTLKNKPHSKIKSLKSSLRLDTHKGRLPRKLRKYVKYGGQLGKGGVEGFDGICQRVSIQNIRQMVLSLDSTSSFFESTILNDLLHDKALPSFFQDKVTHHADEDKMVQDSVKKDGEEYKKILDVFQDQYDIIGKPTISGQYNSTTHIYIKDSFSGKYAMGFSNFIDSAKTSTLVYLETMHKMKSRESFIQGIPGFEEHTQSIYMDKFYCRHILKIDIGNISNSDTQKQLHVECLKNLWEHCCIYIEHQMQQDPVLSTIDQLEKNKIINFMKGIEFVGFELDAKASKKYQKDGKGINIYKYPTVKFPEVESIVPFEISQSACATYIRKLGDNPYKYCAQRNEKQNNRVVACFDAMLKSLHASFEHNESMQKRFCIALMKYIGDTSHIVLGLLYNYAQAQRTHTGSQGVAQSSHDIGVDLKSMVLIEERPLFIRLVQNDVNFISEPQKVLKEKVPISSGELYISQDNVQYRDLKNKNRKYNCWNFLYIILNSYPAIFGLRGHMIKYRDNGGNYSINKVIIKNLLNSIQQDITIHEPSFKFDVYDANFSLQDTQDYNTKYGIQLEIQMLGEEEIRIYKFYKSYISYSRLLNSFGGDRQAVFLKRVEQALNIIIEEFPASFMNSSRRTCRVCKIAGNTYYNLFLRASKQSFISSINFILNDIIVPYIETFEMSEELFYGRLKVEVHEIIKELVCKQFKFEANDEERFANHFSSSMDNNLARNGNIRISDTENIQLLAKFMASANKLKELIEKKQGQKELVDYDKLHECVFLTEPNIFTQNADGGGGIKRSFDEIKSQSEIESQPFSKKPVVVVESLPLAVIKPEYLSERDRNLKRKKRGRKSEGVPQSERVTNEHRKNYKKVAYDNLINFMHSNYEDTQSLSICIENAKSYDSNISVENSNPGKRRITDKGADEKIMPIIIETLEHRLLSLIHMLYTLSKSFELNFKQFEIPREPDKLLQQFIGIQTSIKKHINEQITTVDPINEINSLFGASQDYEEDINGIVNALTNYYNLSLENADMEEYQTDNYDVTNEGGDEIDGHDYSFMQSLIDRHIKICKLEELDDL